MGCWWGKRIPKKKVKEKNLKTRLNLVPWGGIQRKRKEEETKEPRVSETRGKIKTVSAVKKAGKKFE